MILHSFIFYLISLHGIACHFIALYGIAWYCIVFGFFARYRTVMYRCYSAPANYRVVHLVILLFTDFGEDISITIIYSVLRKYISFYVLKAEKSDGCRPSNVHVRNKHSLFQEELSLSKKLEKWANVMLLKTILVTNNLHF